MILTTTTKEDANLNYLKNRGEPGTWFQHKADYVENKPIPRIRLDGFEVVKKAQPTVGEIICPNKCEVVKPNDIHIRLTSADARQIADKFNFQRDKWFDFEGNLSFKPPKVPRKLYSKAAEEIAESNWQQRSHDWFVHNGPKTCQPHHPVNKCIGIEAISNCKSLRASHADEWFKTLSKNNKIQSTAPNSPKIRAKFEGVEYALRARGVGAEMLMHNNKYYSNYDDSKLPYRCNTAEAGENCRSQTYGGNMSQCLDNRNKKFDITDRPHDRVQNDEAREYLNRSRSGTMNLSVDGMSVSIKPKVRPEAEEYYIRSRGNVESIIDQNRNKGYSSPQPVARITTNEARQAYETNKGVMSSIVGNTSYRAPVYPTKNPIRTINGPEAQEIMQKSIGSSMKELVENYKLPPNPPPHQRVGAAGSDEGGLKRTSSVGNLLNSYGKNIAPEVPPLRLYGNAYEVADKYRAKEFYKTIQQVPPSK